MSKKKKQKRYRLRTQWSTLYVAITALFFVSFGFFLTSKILFADSLDVLNTELGKEYNLNSNGKFTINDWIYDEDSNQMQVTLITSDMRSYLSELDFKSVARSNLENPLSTEVVYSSNDIYIVNIKEVPKNFQQVSLRLLKNEVDLSEDFKEENQKINEKDNLITSIYADQSVVKREEIKEGDVRDYAIRVTNKMIADTENQRENIELEIESKELLIEKIQEEISKLKGELLYQTLEEQTDTNNNIYSLEKEISTINREIEEMKVDIESLKTKKVRLEQRINDLKF
ncbi:hypothetical protein NM897_17370 (plasmid) [Planococcus maritimus]|uniref:hypothetical protein n=1 Tax=Planococcus maritimus TaxID=192421 RepID=UPI003138CA2C